MGRRQKQGLLDDLVKMPWPVGIAFGVVAFAGIRWGFGAFFVVFGGPILGGAGAQLGGMLTPLAWVVMLGCWLAAFFSYLGSRKRVALLEVQTGLGSLRSMSWQQFEQLVGEAYRRSGFTVQETGQGGADGGVDLLLSRAGHKTLVQCKQWRSQQVGVSVVREMLGLMTHHGASGGIIACVGTFSPDAVQFAQGKPIELLSGRNLVELVQSVQGSQTVSSEAPERQERIPRIPSEANPSCPRCSKSMVRRTNRGNGQVFWGCSGYPGCKGTIAIS